MPDDAERSYTRKTLFQPRNHRHIATRYRCAFTLIFSASFIRERATAGAHSRFSPVYDRTAPDILQRRYEEPDFLHLPATPLGYRYRKRRPIIFSHQREVKCQRTAGNAETSRPIFTQALFTTADAIRDAHTPCADARGVMPSAPPCFCAVQARRRETLPHRRRRKKHAFSERRKRLLAARSVAA